MDCGCLKTERGRPFAVTSAEVRLTDVAAVQAYKYVPFGPVEEVMPYLVRRAQENSTVLGGVQKEKAMVAKELRRRILRLGRA